MADTNSTCPCYVVRHTECPIHGQEFGTRRVLSNAEVRAFLETLASEPAPRDLAEAWTWAHGVAKRLIGEGL